MSRQFQEIEEIHIKQSWRKKLSRKNIYSCLSDIYYAKYYGKGGGKWSAWEKNLGVRGKKKGGKLH